MLNQIFLVNAFKYVVLALLSLGAAVPALAGAVSVKYTGTVSQIIYAQCKSFEGFSCNAWNNTSPDSLVLENVLMTSVGERFNGGFSYYLDSAAIRTEGSSQTTYLDSAFDSYFQSSNISVSNRSGSTFGGHTAVVNNNVPLGGSEYDAFAAYAWSTDESWYTSSGWIAMIDIFLLDWTSTVFDSYALPENLDLASFQYTQASLVFLNRDTGDQLRLTGAINALVTENSNNVPEPTTSALVLLGLAVTAVMTRRGRRKIRF